MSASNAIRPDKYVLIPPQKLELIWKEERKAIESPQEFHFAEGFKLFLSALWSPLWPPADSMSSVGYGHSLALEPCVLQYASRANIGLLTGGPLDHPRLDFQGPPISIAPAGARPPVSDPLDRPRTDFRDPPKEVWNGNIGVRLCWNGHSDSSDEDANRCFQSMVRVDSFFRETFKISPIDDPASENLMRTDIHHPEAFNQAFWRPGDRRVCCGDCSPEIFSSFAANAEVISHEFSHAALYYLSRLDYQFQSGAIHESFSDILSVMEKHYRTKTQAGAPDANWNVCEGLIRGAALGTSLRSLSHPGFGFRGHPILGNDDQVGHMSSYQVEPLAVDYGGVHKYSGIANRAFYLAAMQEAGFSWEKIGKVWRLALTRSRHDIDFAGFARKTVKAVKKLGFGEAVEHIVASSWSQLGVLTDMAPPPSAAGTAPKASEEPPLKRKILS